MPRTSPRKRKQVLITDQFPKRKDKPAVEKKKTKVEQQDTEKGDGDLCILREFDFCSDYGPCMNITRIERWNRANTLGLNPSKQVLNIINKHSSEEKYTKCIWDQHKILQNPK